MSVGEGPTLAEVSEGDRLPPFKVLLTLQRLVMEAGANRDFARIHHDPDVARSSGAPAPYANTTFVETLLEAGIRSWAGLAPRISVLEFTMTDFNCAGEEVCTGGTVTGKSSDGGVGAVELELWVESSERGRTVSGKATVLFEA